MVSTTRRQFIALTAGGIAVGTLSVGQATAAGKDKIRIGILALTSHSPSIIAEGKGYFGEQGLAVKFVQFQAAQPMAVAIASGDIDFGMTAISGGLVSLAEKGAVRVIGGALQEVPGIEGQKILASKKAYDAGMTTPAKITGHSFGVTTAGSSFQYMADKIADKCGFPRSSIRIVPLQKVPAVIASLKSGQIDAWSIVPNIADALTKGPSVVEIGKISDYIPHYQVTTVFTSKKNVDAKPELVKRFLAGLSKGIADYDAALVKKTMTEDETKAIVAMIHKYVYASQPIEKAGPRIRHGAMWINENCKMNVESIKDQLEWFKSAKLVPADASMDNLVNTSFVETF